MKYYVHINKKVQNIKVCRILKPLGNNENFMTKLFMKLFRVKSSQPSVQAP
ncbi:MAG: hypothetical protein QXR58_00610 [Candidatus Micrarchaeaceae archaeon]